MNTDSGQYYLASFIVLPDPGHEGDWTGVVAGQYTMALTAGYPWGYSFDIPIPEPSGLALLAIGGLALIRRR